MILSLPLSQSLILVLAISLLAYVLGRARAIYVAQSSGRHLAALPGYYGWYSALFALILAGIVGMLGWVLNAQDGFVRLAMPIAAMLGAGVSVIRISARFKSQERVEALIGGLLFACGGVAIMTTLGIILSLAFETGRFFGQPDVSVIEFFTGLEWSAQTSAAFGAVPLFFGTFFIAALALVFAAPTGVFTAIYLSEYAQPGTRRVVKPLIEILAGVPTVVYGFFAVLVVAPVVHNLADALNAGLAPLTGRDATIPAQPRNALSAGLVMAVMIIPLITSLSDDVLRTVPGKLRNGALGLGATKSEMMKQIVLPSARSGLLAVMLLAISRAIGETMIVLMVAGDRANITLNPFESSTTVTVQIVSLLTGEPEFENSRTLSAFALGAVLFGVTLLCNIVAQHIVDRQRRQHVQS